MLSTLKFACAVMCMVITLGADAQALFPAIEKDGKLYGYIDTLGNFVHRPQFENAFPYRNGYAVVMKNKKWGVINVQNESIIPFVYDDAQSVVAEGKVTVKKADKWGVVNLKNEPVVPFAYDYMSVFNEGYVVGGKFLKGKGNNKILDVAIMSEKRLYLDYGSYKLPGYITNGKDWSLGQWPIVRNGFITLLYDHSFDYDPVFELDKKFHYLIPHHVSSGRPHKFYKEIIRGAPVTDLPLFAAGYLPEIIDRLEPDTLTTFGSWDPTIEYYAYDEVAIDKSVYRAVRDNKGKDPKVSSDDWEFFRPIVLPRYEMILRASRVAPHSDVMYRSFEDWQSDYNYYTADLVHYRGLTYEAIQDNVGEIPVYSPDQWRQISIKQVDTTFVYNYVVSTQDLVVSGASSFVDAGEDSYLISVNDSLMLLKQGWQYDLKIPLNKLDLVSAKVSNGLIIVKNRDSGKWGIVDARGSTKVPFEYTEISEFSDKFAVARKDNVYGLLTSSGTWAPLPQHQKVIGVTRGAK